MLNEESLLFRRQFVASKKQLSVPLSWEMIPVGNILVHAHPELNIAVASGKHAQIVILGDVFDPHSIEFGNQDIAQRLVERIVGFEDFETHSKSLSGRWACFVAIGGQVRIYPDAGATHTVYYTAAVENDDEMFLGTQPGVLLEYCGIKKDPELISQYDNYAWIGWWPGAVTPYKNVKKLLANHYLDLNTLESGRFWPKSDLGSLGLREAAKEIAVLTQNTIRSIAKRSPVYLCLTGGWDSRMLFACSDFDNPDIHFLSYRFPMMDHHDIAIPEELAKRSNSVLRILELNDQDLHNPEVLEFHKRNSAYMCWMELSCIHSATRRLPPEFVVLQGIGGESFRRAVGGLGYQRLFQEGKLESKHFARFGGFEGNDLLIEVLSEWMHRDFPTGTNAYLPALMEIENLMGSWSTLLTTGCNTLNSMFTPFNSLEMFELGFRVDIKHRVPPNDLAREICRAAAAWVLDYPVNTSRSTEIRKITTKLKQFLPWRVHTAISRKYKEVGWKQAGLQEHYGMIHDYPPLIAEFMKDVA
ncbi:MAG: hypothetical protein WBQ27_03210 [Thermoanaerobaculia bacterium]